MDDIRKPNTAMWLALVAGALLRAAFVLHHPLIAGDTLVYGDLAQNLVHHHIFGLTDETIRPTLIRLPGYPLFLAACFAVFGEARYVAVLWVQVAVDLLSCGLLLGLSARLWGRRAGLAVLWLAALCPFTANYTAVAVTETLSLFCVVLAFFALERWLAGLESGTESASMFLGWAGILGAALAGAVLLRPDQGLLAAALLPCMLLVVLRRRDHAVRLRALSLAIAAGVFVLPLLLWGVRNWRVFHVVQPLAPRYATDPDEMVSYGFQRWFRTWGVEFQSSLEVYWKYDGETLRLGDLPARAFDSPAEKQETAAVYEMYNRNPIASPKVDAAFERLAAERVAAYPLRYFILLPVGRELNMWLRPRTETMKLPVAWWRMQANPAGSLAALTYAALNAAYLALALWGLLRWWRTGKRKNVVVVITALAFVALRCALLLSVDNSEPRYTLECFPVIFLLGGLALARRCWPRF